MWFGVGGGTLPPFSFPFFIDVGVAGGGRLGRSWAVHLPFLFAVISLGVVVRRWQRQSCVTARSHSRSLVPFISGVGGGVHGKEGGGAEAHPHAVHLLPFQDVRVSERRA